MPSVTAIQNSSVRQLSGADGLTPSRRSTPSFAISSASSRIARGLVGGARSIGSFIGSIPYRVMSGSTIIDVAELSGRQDADNTLASSAEDLLATYGGTVVVNPDGSLSIASPEAFDDSPQRESPIGSDSGANTTSYTSELTSSLIERSGV